MASTTGDTLPRHWQLLTQFLLALALIACGTDSVFAQVGRTVPRQIYYQGKFAFYMGEYRDAERAFASAIKSANRIGQSRWIDSICGYSMLGEVYYHQGNLAASLEAHEAAISVHLVNTGWMSRLRYPQLQPTNSRIEAKIAWGQRATMMAALPDSISSLEGTLDLTTPFEIGGAVNPAHMKSVDGVEVVRCLAVSLRRRAELLGPTAAFSSSSTDITNSFAEVLAPPGHWVAAWVETLYGLALMGMGRDKEGASHLAKGRLAGNLDHQLTGIALLEIGKFYLRQGEYAVAIQHLQQASLAAARFEQPEIVEEAFHYMTSGYLASEGRGAMPNVQAALNFADSERYWRLSAALRLSAAELAVYANDSGTAAGWLSQARTIMARRELMPTDMGGWMSYLEAMAQFRAGNGRAARSSMQSALGYMSRGSLRRFHLTLTDSLYKAGRRASFTPREAEVLYSVLLREPRDIDWRTEPLETMTMQLDAHVPYIERWFNLLIGLKDYDEAARVAEFLRRHRFYSTLPFGGRILSLRWLIDGEQAMLGKSGMQRQSELRTKYPAIAKLSRRAEQLRQELRQEPLVTDDADQLTSQRKLFDELSDVSNQLENIVAELALRREPAPLVFPPQPSLRAIQRGMKDDQAILMFVTTAKGWHAWFIRKDMDEYWPIRNERLVRRGISELLRALGNRNRNSVLDAEDDLNDKWKEPATAIWKSLIGELPSNGWDGLDELVIVPDGPLWYLPFELLQVPADQIEGSEVDELLLSKVRIRYAPVASLSVGDSRGRIADPKTVVVGGQLVSGESSEHARAMLASLKEVHPELQVIAKRTPQRPSRYTAGLMDKLIVWNDVDMNARKPFGWSPAQYDRGKAESKLADWIEYPWGAPDQIFVPGYHTLAEANLNKQASGHEVFLAACGLMASGTRTALLSRWRTGGKTPSVLVRELAIGLTESSASEAWRTAVELSRIESIDPQSEPRLRSDNKELDIKADHPFFWAGYILLDTGSEPAPVLPAEPPPAEGQVENDEVGAPDEEPQNGVEAAGEEGAVDPAQPAELGDGGVAVGVFEADEGDADPVDPADPLGQDDEVPDEPLPPDRP